MKKCPKCNATLKLSFFSRIGFGVWKPIKGSTRVKQDIECANCKAKLRRSFNWVHIWFLLFLLFTFCILIGQVLGEKIAATIFIIGLIIFSFLLNKLVKTELVE